MAQLPLTLACFDYDRVRALKDGLVRPEGVDLTVKILRPRELFPRMLDDQEFEVAELSLASYVSLIARGDCPFVALPVALSKLFRHSCIYVRSDSGITRPEDLKGRRVGTTQYGSTAAVYIKGMLADEYGIAARDMTWFMGGLTAPTQKPLLPLELPGDIRLTMLPEGETLERMLAEDRLDALFSIYFPQMFLDGSPKIRRLFPDHKAVEQAYYAKTGIFPIMHTVVVRRDIAQRHPWVLRSLYQAFLEAKSHAVDHLYDTDALHLALPFLLDHIEESRRVFGPDIWAYGFAPNRPALAAIGRYVHEQGLAPRVVAAEEIFPTDLD
jgi:4,5-dihydroxyphthalate decarboxylase